MSDTRTIYLLTQNNIYCSDPKIKQSSDLPLTYLDMSDFDNLNPTRGTIVSGLAGAVSTYEPYDATITLTFKNRQERAEWIQKNSEQVYQIAVANTISQNRVYNKKCAITSFEFVENPYTNGIQTVLTLKLFGKWQSSLTEIEINSGTYSGGTKSYTLDIPIIDSDDGADGVAGNPNADGKTPYFHIAYANSADGKDGFYVGGGTNLLLNSVFTSGFTSWNNENNAWAVDSGTYDGNPIIKSPTTVGNKSRLIQTIKPSLSDETKLTVSFNAKGTTAGDKVFITLYSLDAVNSANISLTTDMARYSFTMTIPTNFQPQNIYFWNNTAGDSIYLNEIKLETGTTATPWSPAPSEAHPTYRGTYTDYTQADSLDPSVYTWGTLPVEKTYAYDSELRYGITHYVSAIKLDGEHGFVLETEPRNGGLTVNLRSDYNGHQFALESNWPNLITGLSSEFVAYPYTSFTTLDRFTMLAGGAVTSYGWNIENNEMPYLYEMFNNVEKYPISVGAVDQNGTVIPIHVYTYTAQDFI